MRDHLVAPPAGISFPAGGEAVLLEAADGLMVRAVFFRPPVEPSRGTIFVLPGRAEFIEKYGEVFERLLARSFAVAALDWRGQGGSERQLRNPRKGHVEDFDDYLLDLDALVVATKARAMPEPYGLLAHSMGGAIALLALMREPTVFARAVLSAPMIAVAGLKTQTGARILARVLSGLGLSGLFVPGGGRLSIMEQPFDGNPLTSDPDRYARAALWLASATDLAIGDPTIGWIDAAFEAMMRFDEPAFGLTNRTPVLMLLAGHDEVVGTRAAAALANRVRAASAIELRGARHEIMMESDAIQAEFWAAFDAFMRFGNTADPAAVSAPAATPVPRHEAPASPPPEPGPPPSRSLPASS